MDIGVRVKYCAKESVLLAHRRSGLAVPRPTGLQPCRLAELWRWLMITLLRLISLLLGCALTVAPPYLLRLFASGLGEPHAGNAFATFLSPILMIGLALGTGPLLIGLPRLVAGAKNPRVRLVAGAFLIVSSAGFLAIGLDGYLTRVMTPTVLLVEVVLFAFFIWPAWHFSAKGPRHPEHKDRQHSG